MKAIDSRALTTGILFLLTLASGLWVSRSGRPLNTVIFTIHKLIALGTVIFTAAYVYHLRRPADLKTLEIGALILIAIVFVALFATGALLSRQKPSAPIILTMHQIAPFLAVVSVALTLFFLSKAK
jgi:hypothetical protein